MFEKLIFCITIFSCVINLIDLAHSHHSSNLLCCNNCFLEMAIAGLHNVSAFGHSFFGEARRDQPRTQASTVLQIWREIEGEHTVNQPYSSRQHRNGSDSECSSTSTSSGRVNDNRDDISQQSDESENHGFTGSEMDHEDNSSIASEQSIDLGEIERERVRKIFREWMNSGSKGPPSYGFNLNNRSGQRLGENECQRVRSSRERVQTTAQQKSNCGSVRDRVGSQLNQGCDGLAINHLEIGSRRRIRRLCGRQTLLDLLLRAESERESELVTLSERRPVSDFPHRHRIQALLRGRFLRNESSVLHDRTSSNAANNELSLLRQRHAVSDLREEFLSKLENSASTSANIAKSDSLSNGENNKESESPVSEREVSGIILSELESAVDTNMSPQECEVLVTGAEVPSLDNEGGGDPEVLLDVGNDSHVEEPTNESNLQVEEPASEATQQQVFSDVDNERHSHRINVVMDELSINEATHSDEYNEAYNENELRNAQRSSAFETDGSAGAMEVNAIEEIHLPNSTVEEFEDSGIEVAEAELVDAMEEEHENNVEEHDQMQASHEDWPNQDFEEAIDSWLDMPTRAADESFARIDTSYFPDDENAHSMEIRELFSRRRVSSLLRSGFRESLNQVLQSHVERLGHASSEDWELEHTPPDHDQLLLNVDQNPSQSNGSARSHFAPTSDFFTSQLLWEELPPATDWPRHIPNQQLGTEWEVINELRLDMARLQQRMDNMQSMLETCMDIQIELQRAVRQEVSAALNRSDANKSGATQIDDDLRWDHVRKGSCCLCRGSKIDSLLYRCGHMCCCSKCAENLVQEKGNCPMCEAPVVEVVRAYFVQ